MINAWLLLYAACFFAFAVGMFGGCNVMTSAEETALKKRRTRSGILCAVNLVLWFLHLTGRVS